QRYRRMLALVFMLLAGCAQAIAGQVGDPIFRDGFESSPGFPANRAEASRFLAQATFGSTTQEIDSLIALGYDAWLTRQIALPGSYMLDHMRAASGHHGPVEPIPFHFYRYAWMVRAAAAEDQLRQRVAFALSQIMVVSERGNSLANDGL